MYRLNTTEVISLGRRGENLATTVDIDISALAEKWPDATFTLVAKRYGDANPHEVSVSIDEENVLHWTVTDDDTSVSGNGEIELRAATGAVLAKSDIMRTNVKASMTGEVETNVQS